MGEHRTRCERMRSHHRPQEINLTKAQVNRKRREAQGSTRHVHPHVGRPIYEAEVNCQDGRPDEGSPASLVETPDCKSNTG